MDRLSGRSARHKSGTSSLRRCTPSGNRVYWRFQQCIRFRRAWVSWLLVLKVLLIDRPPLPSDLLLLELELRIFLPTNGGVQGIYPVRDVTRDGEWQAHRPK